jgi:hypothetical protein
MANAGEVAPDYGRSLRLQVTEAGLQGALQADAFKALLQFVCDVQGDRDVMTAILEQLKQGVCVCVWVAWLSGWWCWWL